MLNITKEDYIQAEKLFNIFYSNKILENNKKNIKYVEPSPITISTITLTGKIGDYVMAKFLYDRLPINNDIIYTENGKEYKGKKTKKKISYSKKEKMNKLDKRKLGRGKPLSNQISIGMRGLGVEHKNPVCLKIFKNGKIQMTGCKTLEEGYKLYEKLYTYISKIPKKFYLKEDDKYFYIEPIKNMLKPTDLHLDSEMINASYQLNFEINQKELNNLLEKFKENELFVTYDSCVSSPAVRCYLMNMSKYDERKKKKKQPSVFLYRSGSVNIIVWKMDMLYDAYNFINTFIKENFDKIVSKNIL